MLPYSINDYRMACSGKSPAKQPACRRIHVASVAVESTLLRLPTQCPHLQTIPAKVAGLGLAFTLVRGMTEGRSVTSLCRTTHTAVAGAVRQLAESES
jgi:hypothetical protein